MTAITEYDEQVVGKIVDPDDWIHYNPNVGVGQLHMIGLPGSGKSNLANSLANKCVLHENERIVMPGDRFCEWRHFVNHPTWRKKKFSWKVFVPEGIEIKPLGIPEGIIKGFIPREYDALDIENELDDNTRLYVIYDQHLPRSERVKLWVRIGTQLLNRIVFTTTAIVFLFHEAGNYFPENARSDHWTAVNDFSELFVEFRKGLVRTILVSQIKTEIESTLRGKCLDKIFRKGWPGRTEVRPVRKAAPFLRLHQFIYVQGGLYNLDCEIDKFFENKQIWKMIPRVSVIEGGEVKQKQQKFPEITCEKCGGSWIPRVKRPFKCQRCGKKLPWVGDELVWD